MAKILNFDKNIEDHLNSIENVEFDEEIIKVGKEKTF